MYKAKLDWLPEVEAARVAVIDPLSIDVWRQHDHSDGVTSFHFKYQLSCSRHQLFKFVTELGGKEHGTNGNKISILTGEEPWVVSLRFEIE